MQQSEAFEDSKPQENQTPEHEENTAKLSNFNSNSLYEDKFLHEILSMPKCPNIDLMNSEEFYFVLTQLVAYENLHRWGHA